MARSCARRTSRCSLSGALLTRLPFAINGLAVLLYLRGETGSFGTAGLVAGALALGVAAGRRSRAGSSTAAAPACWSRSASCTRRSAARCLGAGRGGRADAPLLIAAALARRLLSARRRGAALALSGPDRRRAARPRRLRARLGDDRGRVRQRPAADSGHRRAVGPAYALVVSAALVLTGTTLFNARLPGFARPGPAAGQHPGLFGRSATGASAWSRSARSRSASASARSRSRSPRFSGEQGGAALAGVLLAIWSRRAASAAWSSASRAPRRRASSLPAARGAVSAGLPADARGPPRDR